MEIVLNRIIFNSDDINFWKELRDDCKSVLSNHSLAEELLPCESGFFFGSTEYDKYYYNDLEYTVELIGNILDKYSSEHTFSYQSSW